MSNEKEIIKNTALGEEMQFVLHESGLRVYLFPKKEFSKYYAIYGTEYGSLNQTFTVPGESEEITVPDGIAHYLEHKMFEEPDGTDAFTRFAETGGSANAFTSFNLTAYLFSCTDRFYDNLDILLDFVNKPYFTEENVKKEQGIIGQEIKMYDDEPEWRVFFNTLLALFHNNPVKTDIAGTVESIAKITPDVLYKCYNTFYNPANMILVMVGDIDIDEAISHIDKFVLKDRNRGKIEKLKFKEPKERVKEYIEQTLDVSQPIFRIGFKENSPYVDGEKLLKKEIATNIILEALLGPSSDLHLKMYEDGYIDSSFDTETELEYEYGFTLIGGESKNPQKVYEIIKNAIDKAIEKGIDKDSISRAKKVLISQDIKSYNSVTEIGNGFLRALINNQNPLDYKKAVESVTYEDITARLKEHFDTSNCVLSVVKPS